MLTDCLTEKFIVVTFSNFVRVCVWRIELEYKLQVETYSICRLFIELCITEKESSKMCAKHNVTYYLSFSSRQERECRVKKGSHNYVLMDTH